MPRAPRPEGLRILDYFRTADLGEAKVIAQLAAEVVAQRLTITTAEVPNPAASRPAKRTRTRRAAPISPATQADSTQDHYPVGLV